MNVTVTPTHQFHIESQTVIANYQGFLDFETFKQICINTIDKLKKHNASNVLANTSALKVMPKENQLWIQTVWFPLAIQSGMRKIAFLVPDNPFGRASMEAANKNADNEKSVAMRYFFDKDEALNWIVENG